MSLELDFPRMLRTYIASVWALELVLFMRADASRWWRPDELAAEMLATVRLVEISLQHFRRLGLVVTDANGRYRFGPISPLLRAFCEQLSDEFLTQPISIITLINDAEERSRGLLGDFRSSNRSH